MIGTGAAIGIRMVKEYDTIVRIFENEDAQEEYEWEEETITREGPGWVYVV